MMSKIGKDECKEKKKKIHSHSSSKGTEWMQGKNKDECISIHPFHLEMCLLLFQKKNALLPYIIHKHLHETSVKRRHQISDKKDCQVHLGAPFFYYYETIMGKSEHLGY